MLTHPRRWLVLIAFSMCLCGNAQELSAQQDSTRTETHVVPAAMLGGVIGSGAGLALGVGVAFMIMDDTMQRDGSWEHGKYAVALGAGSTLAAAVGAHTLAKWRGGTPSFARTLAASTAGLVVGVGAGALIELALDNDEPIIIAYVVTQGTVAGLGAALWQRK